ncbi:MAG: heme-binding domain-containing protein [Saprospiraceae bacterium]
MKTALKLIPISILTLLVFLGNTSVPDTTLAPYGTGETLTTTDSVIIQYTGKIKTIIDAKCYDCHSEKGKDEDAKKELLWDQLPKLAKMDQVYALDAIIESLEKNEMPPEDHLKKHPEDKLTKEETKLLMDWADALATKLFE